MDHNKLWKILQEMGIPDHPTCLLRNTYACQEATARTGHGTTDWFQIGKGICQGYIFSPCLSESESHSVVSDSLQFHGLYSPWNSPGQNTGVGSLFLLQRIFLIEGSNPGLLHCRRILYQVRHKGNARILEWVAYPFSSRSS